MYELLTNRTEDGEATSTHRGLCDRVDSFWLARIRPGLPRRGPRPRVRDEPAGNSATVHEFGCAVRLGAVASVL
jgi:hypothetical protein